MISPEKQALLDQASDVQSLRTFAAGYRVVSYRHARGEFEPDIADPGPHHTAIQFEWAAREIVDLRAERDTLREALRSCASAAGAPDAADGCRFVIAIVDAALSSPAAEEENDG